MATSTFRLAAVVYLIGFLGCALAQEGVPNVNEILSSVQGISGVPGLQNLNLANLTAFNQEHALNLIRKKCEKNGGATAFDTAFNAQGNVAKCLQSLVNVTELQEEMALAAPTGDLDVVFKKYCRKTPIFKDCLTNYTSSVGPCLDEAERENIKIFHNITDSLLKFVCFKEGDRIALFIAAGGPQCFTSKRPAMQNCANSTYGGYVQKLADPTTGINPQFVLPSLTFDDKACSDMAKFQTCIVQELEGCDDPTPANLLDSIFNFIKKVTPCSTK